MDIWVLSTTVTDLTDHDDTGVLGIFRSQEHAIRGAERLIPCLWQDTFTLETGFVDDDTVRLYIGLPGTTGVLWLLERHVLDEYAET